MSIMPNEKAMDIQRSMSLAMEYQREISVIYLQNGQILHFIGFIHYWNEETDDIRIINTFGDIIRLKLDEVVILYVLEANSLNINTGHHNL
ncbi:YolD-like family protein [Metabacillus indicus]|uniref:YolD-like family protein n=1 Tax=Metabacillus indicus TaxID=246786 RepID=UPI0004930646|nr:YolD-like family protein [Metabacillus indicus]KEZ48579.1 hypothetical protein AZ46_0216840 [Metabacillus indicus LMG 22858]